MQLAESVNNFERLFDVEMNVTVRFGKTQIPLRDVVRFNVGSMIELNRTVDEPVELLVNDHPFAQGEVVVIDGYYGVRITEIGTTEERTRTLSSEPAGDAVSRNAVETPTAIPPTPPSNVPGEIASEA